MKKLIFTLFMVVTATGLSVQAHVNGDDYLGLPGDNLNLFAVLKLFQESQTLESFERDLNNENRHINNLDLDEDGRIDYIRVVDHVDGNYHTIVLQDALSPRDIQDVAVFTVHREHNGRVEIQLTGDEALYGPDYIIEPNYEDLSYGETPNPGYSDYRDINGQTVYVTRTTTYEVAAWPLIRFMFMPTYVIWVSPWHYHYYPSYWHPWRPFYWHYYYGYHYNWDNYYYGHYHVWHQHRDSYWQTNYYARRRAYSPAVVTRVRSGSYKRTYSHPEARHAGYESFYKQHPEQRSRRTELSIKDPVAERRSSNTQVRQSSSGATNARQPNTSTSGARRSTETRSTQTNTRVDTKQPVNTSRSRTETRTNTGTDNSRRTSTGTRTETRPEAKPVEKSAQPARERSSQPRNNKSATQSTERRSSGESSKKAPAPSPSEKKGTRR